MNEISHIPLTKRSIMKMASKAKRLKYTVDTKIIPLRSAQEEAMILELTIAKEAAYKIVEEIKADITYFENSLESTVDKITRWEARLVEWEKEEKDTISKLSDASEILKIKYAELLSINNQLKSITNTNGVQQ